MNTDSKNGHPISQPYGPAMATPMAREPMARYGTVRNGTGHHQDPGINPSVPNPRTPVDNPKTLTVPSWVWGRIATTAEDRGTTVEEILVAAIQEITKPRNRRERVLQLVRAGLTDAVVAERTGELKNYVANVRRSAGLPPNRQQRTNTETPTKEKPKT